MKRYFKLQSDVTKWLKENAYSFHDLVKIIGCGWKTLERYENAGIIHAMTSGYNADRRAFTQEELDKATFVYDLSNKTRTPVYVAAAFYDYLKVKRTKIDLTNLLDRIQDYKDRY